MTAIICTTIICLTVVLCTKILVRSLKPETPAQQIDLSSPATEEALEQAYKEAEKDEAPDFQNVIDTINKEFIRILEEEDG